MHPRRIVDICFVLDATSSNQSIFNMLCLFLDDINFDIHVRFRRIEAFNYGAVVYRDPIDYNPLPPDILKMIKEQKNAEKQKFIEKSKEIGLYDKEFEDEKREFSEFYDEKAFPINKNVYIPFSNYTDNLIYKLASVECDGGGDEPEDWIGALTLALNELKWNELSRKYIIWISDANAHGKRFCGFNNHNEEEMKMKPLVEMMVSQRINFIGINIVKSDESTGCEMTLNKMKKIFDECAQGLNLSRPLNFVIDCFRPKYDKAVFGEDNWPREVMEKCQKLICDRLFELISIAFLKK